MFERLNMLKNMIHMFYQEWTWGGESLGGFCLDYVECYCYCLVLSIVDLRM